MKKIILSAIFFISCATALPNLEYKNPITKELLHNIARVESNHNPKAVSKKGALGLYQIRYSVWKDELKKHGIIKNRNDLFDKHKNEKAAKFILSHYYKKTGCLRKTLEKYSGNASNYYFKVTGEK